MQLSIGRLRNGYCVSWRDEDGKRRRYQLAARNRKEAESEALDVYRRKSWEGSGNTVTVADCWNDYRAFLADRPSGRTLDYTGKAILDAFGHLRPDQIGRDTCERYSHLRTERDHVSAGTVHTELGHLRSALRFAEKTRMIDRAPHIWRPAKPAPKERFLTRDEITRLIDAASAPHVRLAIILLLGTAARVGAILDLEWKRVDFERGTINLRLDDQATRKGRAVVPMNSMTRAALSTAREAALTEYVVEYACGKVGTIRKGFAGACERAGIEGATIHDLRRTAAVHMVSAGIPIFKVAQYLGHANTAMVEKVYGRFAPTHMQDAADVLNFTEIRKARA